MPVLKSVKQQNWLNIQNPFLCWNIIVIDVLVIFALFEGVYGDYDRHFSFYQYQGSQNGVFPYVYPALLVQLILLEGLFEFDDEQSLSTGYIILMLVDAMTILSILLCVILDVNFGYYHTLPEYLTVQLTSRAVPFLLFQAIICEMTVIVGNFIQSYLPRQIQQQQSETDNSKHAQVPVSIPNDLPRKQLPAIVIQETRKSLVGMYH